ncbi:MAG: hypothetical protein R3B59_03240 [Dehalococcoidia bacterium]
MATLRREDATAIEEGDAVAGSQAQEAEPTGVRSGCLVALGLVALGAAFVVLVMWLWPSGDGQVDIGRAGDYRPGSVVYHSSDGFFVATQPDGSVLALSDIDPHNPPGRRSCRVTFRPDLGVAGETGRFFDSCTGSLYDIGGQALSGDGLDLEPLPVQRDEEGNLRVKPTR